MSVTLGQSKGGSQDAAMADDSKKKDGGAAAGPKGDSKLKDPTMAHETLEIAKNVP
jgi:hypothetical protein